MNESQRILQYDYLLTLQPEHAINRRVIEVCLKEFLHRDYSEGLGVTAYGQIMKKIDGCQYRFSKRIFGETISNSNVIQSSELCDEFVMRMFMLFERVDVTLEPDMERLVLIIYFSTEELCKNLVYYKVTDNLDQWIAKWCGMKDYKLGTYLSHYNEIVQMANITNLTERTKQGLFNKLMDVLSDVEAGSIGGKRGIRFIDILKMKNKKRVFHLLKRDRSGKGEDEYSHRLKEEDLFFILASLVPVFRESLYLMNQETKNYLGSIMNLKTRPLSITMILKRHKEDKIKLGFDYGGLLSMIIQYASLMSLILSIILSMFPAWLEGLSMLYSIVEKWLVFLMSSITFSLATVYRQVNKLFRTQKRLCIEIEYAISRQVRSQGMQRNELVFRMIEWFSLKYAEAAYTEYVVKRLHHERRRSGAF